MFEMDFICYYIFIDLSQMTVMSSHTDPELRSLLLRVVRLCQCNKINFICHGQNNDILKGHDGENSLSVTSLFCSGRNVFFWLFFFFLMETVGSGSLQTSRTVPLIPGTLIV